MIDRVVITGGGGFLGWHTRVASFAEGRPVMSLAVGEFFDVQAAVDALAGASRVVHIAGVNRASESEVRDGNILFAAQLATALRQTPEPPPVVVFANSTQSTNGSVYGEAKSAAAGILREAAHDLGLRFVDVLLPNLFGEHGRPFYNAVTSTFCHLLAIGETPTVEQDRDLTLLHAQNAADLLLGVAEQDQQSALVEHETVTGLLRRLEQQSERYRDGEIPDLSTAFDRDLFNTYRSYTVDRLPFTLTRRADQRGSFFEVIRSHGGTSQSSFSTTAPGVTRGDHFHRRKVERFTVLSGSARISLRRLFTADVVSFGVDGDEPVAIDMPTMWAHNIVNVGDDVLFTSFWTNDIFDPENPDTIAEVV